MKRYDLLCFLLACAATPTMLAQQNSMPSMPGMNMGTPAPAQERQSGATPKPNRTRTPADKAPADLKSMGHDAGNQKAKAAAASEQNSVDQQKSQDGVKAAKGSDAQSVTVPMQLLQEPEAVGFRTGGDLPAPELLTDVVARTPMQVDEFLLFAEQNNPTLAQAQRNVDRSRQQAHQVGLPPDPIVGYNGDHIRGGEYHGGEEGAFFSQIFVLGHKLALRQDAYRAEGRANEFAVEVQRARIRNDVGTAFIDALAAQQSVDLHDRLLKVALDAETNSHELERVGQADASTVLMAEITAEQAKVDFSDAQRMFLSAFSRLATLAGYASLPVHPLAGGLVAPPRLNAAELVAASGENSPLITQAKASVDVATARLKDARREAVPNLTVTAGEWYSGEQLSSSTKKAGWESFAQAGVQLPLWNRNQGNVGAARAVLDRANKEVTRTQLWTRNRAEPYADEYERSRFAAERYEQEMIPRARRAYDLEVTKYQQMAQEYPAVLTAQHMLFSLQLSYVESLHREWKAAIALQNYTLTNALDEPVSLGTDATTLNLPAGEIGQ